MSTTNGNMKKFTVIGPGGQKYVMIPVDSDARQAIDEAKSLEFDEDFFTADETDEEVKVGLNGVPFGVNESTPLKILQDDQEGVVIGSKSVFSENIAPAFDQTAQYAVGDVVTHNNRVYKCSTAISVPSTWDESKWAETNINQSQKSVSVKPNNPLQVDQSTPNGDVLRVDSIFSSSVADEFSNSRTYAVNDLVIYSNKVYKCIRAISTPGNWSSNDWTEYKIGHISLDIELVNYGTSNYSNLSTILSAGKMPMCYLSASVTATDSVSSLPKGTLLPLAYKDANKYYFSNAIVTRKSSTEELEFGLFEASVDSSGNWTLTFSNVASPNILVDYFDSSDSYVPGDLVIYGTKLYMAKESISSGNSFNSNNWTEVIYNDLYLYLDASKFTNIYGAVSNSIAKRVPRIFLNQGIEAIYDSIHNADNSVDFLEYHPNSEAYQNAPPRSVFHGKRYKWNSSSNVQSQSDIYVPINGGIHELGNIGTTKDGSYYAECPNNCNANLGHVDGQLNITIKSSDNYHQAPNASFSFIIDRDGNNDPIIAGLTIKFVTETVNRSLNIVCPGYITGGNINLGLYSGTYGLHVMGDTAIVTVIDTDAP